MSTIVGQITVPDLSAAFSRRHADTLVAYIAGKHPECTAYPHAWGNDWGVTISGPIDAAHAEEIVKRVRSLVRLGLDRDL